MIYINFLKSLYFFVTIFLIIMLCNSFLYSQEYTFLNINNPSIRKIPLAVPKFQQFSKGEDTEQNAKKAQKLIVDALSFTGYLKIIDEQVYLANPSETGIARVDIDFLDWTGIGAELLITGGISVNGNKVKLWLRLFDTSLRDLRIS